MEWFPGRVFAFFRRAAKEGRSRRSETSLVQTPVPAAVGSFPWGKLPPKVTDEGNPHHSGQSQPFSGFAARLCLSFPHPVASGGPLSLFRTKKEAKEMRQREPIPKAVPFGILPHRPGGCGPLEIPGGLRRTGDEGFRGTGDLLRHRETSPQAGRGNPCLLPQISAPCRPLPSSLLHERPAQGRSFSFPAPENFAAPHCNICPPVV